MFNTQFNTPMGAPAIAALSLFPRALFAPVPAIKAPTLQPAPQADDDDKHANYAPWVENGYAQVDRAYGEVIRFLSSTALRTYDALLSVTRTCGEKAGKSWHKRQKIADIMGRSVDTFDDGIKELIDHNMVEKRVRVLYFGHNDSNEYTLLPPSVWKFEGRENSAPPPKKSVGRAAKPRRKQKDAYKMKTSKQQTPQRGVAAHNADVVVPSQSEPNPQTKEKPDTETKALANELYAAGFRPRDRALEVAAQNPDECRFQLARLARQKKAPTYPGAWLSKAIERGDGHDDVTPKNRAAAPPSAAQQAAWDEAARATKERAEREHEVRQREAQDAKARAETALSRFDALAGDARGALIQRAAPGLAFLCDRHHTSALALIERAICDAGLTPLEEMQVGAVLASAFEEVSAVPARVELAPTVEGVPPIARKPRVEEKPAPVLTPTPERENGEMSPVGAVAGQIAPRFLSPEEARDQACDEVFEALDEQAREAINAFVWSQMPSYLRHEGKNTEGARRMFARDRRERVWRRHEDAVRLRMAAREVA